MAHDMAQVAGQICSELHHLIESKLTTPDVARQKKKCQKEILKILASTNSSYLSIPNQNIDGKFIYFIRSGKQKVHSLADTQLLEVATASWLKQNFNIELTKDQKSHYISHLKNVQQSVSKIRYPDPIYTLKVEHVPPFESLPDM